MLHCINSVCGVGHRMSPPPSSPGENNYMYYNIPLLVFEDYKQQSLCVINADVNI